MSNLEVNVNRKLYYVNVVPNNIGYLLAENNKHRVVVFQLLKR